MKSLIILLPFALLLGCKVEEEFNCVEKFNCGTETVKYLSQEYNTVQIGDQCWLKENLNVGTKVYIVLLQSNNGTIEKYCYNNEPDSCTKYGGLYHWDEMMQYTTEQGTQGICPPCWHLPTDEEWKVLEGAVDSQYGIGNQEWDISQELRGYDAGMNLKTTSGWVENGNGTDLFGFSGLPGGCYVSYMDYPTNVGEVSCWWTSTEYNVSYAMERVLVNDSPAVSRSKGGKGNCYSVRCLRD